MDEGAPLQDSQRRVRRSPLLFAVPLWLLAVLILILLWEAVRANVPPDVRGAWPWRLELLDMEALGSLLAVAVGAVLARAQYARTVRPYLGWRGSWRKGLLAEGEPAWRVGILNGGQHIAVIESWECRVALRGGGGVGAAPWVPVPDVVATLTAGGLTVGRDYQLIAFGAGFSLVGTGNYETVPVGVFSRRCVERVDVLHVRVRVTDVVGDSHERVLDCLRGARVQHNIPGEEPVK
ncbi:hypothetical protein [Streptomyces sp. OspMP-M43]|uniref:hypothetical protein n=1 Tax=Streptomyces sp. OspMP-M43 TaxID=1839781 RepID=UPI00081B5D12|nr:hypothetical protein [Streptomyces sp. OspMP-M43]SCD86554.1 hypothetical protein GA0115261_102144 [Streptomyces sp. OspMP-M43]